ncbi:MAG: LPS-assembly protein LptD [Pseudomonadota bacterium]
MKPRSAVLSRKPATVIRRLASLAAGTALALVLPALALAQDWPQALPDDQIELSAQVLTYNGGDGIATARGDVVVHYQNYLMRADSVTYNERTGEVTAQGNIMIRDPQGNVLSADEVALTDTLKEGFVNNVRLLLEDGSRVAAAGGERKAARTRFDRAVYSPCEVCIEGDQPLWQIKAVRVIHDQEKKRLYYENAYLEFLGAPVLYLPWLSHPDPSVKRASGFLVPEPRASRTLGYVLEIPYFWNIAPDEDATLTPILTSDEGAVLAAEYRRHLGFGKVKASGSITNVSQRDDTNQKTGAREFRGHIFSDGQFRLGERWRSSYDLRWASDDTYLRRYDVSYVDTLRNQATVEGFLGRGYVRARGLAFQGLRIEDITGLTPISLPEVDYRYESAPLWQNGRVKVNGNLLALTRTSGMDTQRASLQAAWDMPRTFANGLIARLNASLRSDVYRVSDADRPDNPVFAGVDGTTMRFLPRLGLEARWPLINSLGDWTQMLEPMLVLALARAGGNPLAIPNEDSRSFDLDDSNLFSLDRFAGIDRWEGGARATYGVRWSVLARAFETNMMIGQSYRFNPDSARFPQGTGLDGNFSDIVGRIGVNISDKLEFGYRFRFDKQTLEPRRNEIDMTLSGKRYGLSAGYIRLNRDLGVADLENREEIRLSGLYRISGNWTLTAGTIQDLTQGRDPISQSLGVIYSDECLEFRLNYRKNFTADRDINPGTTVTFRIVLKNLG